MPANHSNVSLKGNNEKHNSYVTMAISQFKKPDIEGVYDKLRENTK